jgi:hypothetical protein
MKLAIYEESKLQMEEDDIDQNSVNDDIEDEFQEQIREVKFQIPYTEQLSRSESNCEIPAVEIA